VAEFVRQGGLIQLLPLEVHDCIASCANDVVVPAGGGVEAREALHCFEPFYHAVCGKCGQGPVNRVQRKRRDAFAQPAVQDFGRGMVRGFRKFPVNLQALMGET